ncbi:uncharacterized protein LOC119684152 isoform X1 [Teleopsis dalmanni]|uniref:uncharacterized protein LOC119684152 isoform X1 n=1 Tax=Teleopsis dalmanni TaxID=139649 RepID=UPI0018CD916B|nr:uncharacterized protein LOC119684152 isoform X1 [Teleopsis dalmanni]
MNWLSAVGVDIRSARKCFSISGSLLLMLLLFVAQTACRPPDELYDSLDIVPDEYADVDNVELHHVKMVDGILREDHPIIMYKEDFVSEDYDPLNNNNTAINSKESNATNLHPTRKYKDIASRRRRLNRTETEQLSTVKPTKIYFDVLSQTPVVVDEDLSNKYDTSKVRVEVISLLDKANQNEESKTDNEEHTKDVLNKRPKKYRRQRRDTDTHVVQKRNPYYQIGNAQSTNSLTRPYKENEIARVPFHQKHHIQGVLWNSLNLPVPEVVPNVDERFGSPDETDRVYWGGSPARRNPARTTTTTTTTRRPVNVNDIFHNSDPKDSDFSFITAKPATKRPKIPDIFYSQPVGVAREIIPEISFGRLPFEEEVTNTTPTSLSRFPEQEDIFFTGNSNVQQKVEKDTSTRCLQVAKACCNIADINQRFYCFEQYSCMQNIARIMSICN